MLCGRVGCEVVTVVLRLCSSAQVQVFELEVPS